MTHVAPPFGSQAVAHLRGYSGLTHPDGRRFYRSLLLVDVDLDTGEVTAQDVPVPDSMEPEGVHAVVWCGGTVVGQVTVPGDPADLLPHLPRYAAHQVERDGRAGTPTGCACLPPHPGGIPDPSPDQVTVAVCTRDRPDQVRDCLLALSRMTAPVAEILLVDNASRDERTRFVAERFPTVRYVREPREGLNWARNRALAEARTPIVAFTDDDVLVHDRWVDGLLRGFRDEPRAVIVTGLVVAAELSTPAQVLFEGRGGFGRGLDRKCFDASSGPGPLGPAFQAVTGAAGTGANMAVRRRRVADLGGFDLALDVGTPSGGGGDLELLFRVVAAGDVVVYEPSAVVRHRHRRTAAELARQRRGDGTGTYSIFLGAGSRYGPATRARFVRLAAWWVLKRHVRRAVCSVLWPGLWPPALVFAEIRGMLDATVRGYYDRGLAQARHQWSAHPDEPSVPGVADMAASTGERRGSRGRPGPCSPRIRPARRA